MNTACEQISFISEEIKQNERKNTLRLRERLMTEHGFESFDDTEVLSTVLSYAKGARDTDLLVTALPMLTAVVHLSDFPARLTR